MKLVNTVVVPPDRDPKVLGIFTREKGFYINFFSLLFIIVLQQLAALMVNMVDNVMLGRYTELALTGATLVNQIQFALLEVAGGIGMGMVSLASQYWGKRRIEPIRRIISIAAKLGFGVGLLFMVVCLAVPTKIMGLFTTDAAVVAEGTRYLLVICWTYPIFGLSRSLIYALQSVETAMVGTIMSISTIVINMCLNYCLIYGNLGFPELGVVGAAVATLVSRVVELLIVLVYIRLIDQKLQMKMRDFLSFDKTFFKDYIRVAFPLIISGATWGIAQATHTAILGHIGANAIAANSIAIILFQVFAVVGMSCSNVASVITGKTVGAGRFDMIRSYAKTMQAIFLMLGVFSACMLYVFKDPIVGFYAITDETKELALSFIKVLCITALGTCYEFPVGCGIIAGGGLTKYQAILDYIVMWLFVVPVSCLSAFYFHWSPVVTFFLLKSDQLIKCVPNAIVCNRYKWIRVLTRD